MSDGQYGVRVATNKDGNAYIAGLYGPNGIAQKLKAMGLERNEFQKWIKQGAIIVARKATALAPVQSGKLAESIRGYAGKKITPSNQPSRYIYGGVVIAQPKSETGTNSYGKAVSFGRFYKQSNDFRRFRSFLTGNTRGVRAESIRTPGNPYMRTARDLTRDDVVKMYNREVGQWIRRNGFETEGFGV